MARASHAAGRTGTQVPAIAGLTALLARLARTIASWRYVEVGRRDRRLDLLRGYCVVAMTVDHLDAPTWLYMFTGGNRFFVSAAEGFLFISGLVMGIVYRPIVEAKGMGAATAKALRRALLLYCVTVCATLGFMWVSSRLGLPWAAGVDLREAWPEVVALRRTFYLTDVLLLYTSLVAIAPIAFVLLRARLAWVLLAVSWGVWGAHQIEPIDTPWPSEEGAFYYIAAWQALFFTALAIGWNRAALTARLGWLVRWQTLAASALGMSLLMVVWWQGAQWLGLYVPDGAAALNDAFAKWNLPPARMLASAIVFMLAFLITTHCWVPLKAALGRLLLPLGQSALAAYVVQLMVVGGLTAYRQDMPRADITTQVRGTVFLLFGVLTLWLAVHVWESLRRALVRTTSERTLTRRFDPAAVATVGVLLGAAIAVAPLPARPVAGLVHLRDDRNSLDEPRYSLHVPPRAAEEQPLPVLLVVHDTEDDAEVFGDALTGLADREGWLLVAPQLRYQSDHVGPETVAEESPSLIRGLRDVIAELPASTGLQLRRRMLIFGYGRGAALAERYAFARPNDVRAVALLGGGNYTLPPTGGDDPPFPFGSAGFPARGRRGLDVEALKTVWFWVGVGSNDTDQTTVSRAWDPYLGATRLERARTLAQALRAFGAEVSFDVFSGAGHALDPEMRLAVADFAARVRATPAQQPPRVPPGRVVASPNA